MRLFGIKVGGGQQETEEQAARRVASEHQVAAGGLPLDAMDRLQNQARLQGTPGHLFTSDLSVNELSLVGDAGYAALGQVMGCSVYQVGWQFYGSNLFPNGVNSSGELEMLSEAYSAARQLAIGRMQQEATILGATGVVGVRLTQAKHEWGTGLLEFKAIGTAIRELDAARPAEGSLPFVSDLSGSEFWLLRKSGYRPVGLAVGNCSYYCFPSYMSGGWKNQERTDYTQALYRARELTMSRMESQARSVDACGIIGADVDLEFDRPGIPQLPDTIYHFTAIGTSVAPMGRRLPDIELQSVVVMG